LRPAAQKRRSKPAPLRRCRCAILSIFLSLVVLTGCESPPGISALEHVLRSGEITVITRNNSQCYYLYRGQPVGFEYDLAKLFADDLGVRLKVKIAEQWEGMIPDLKTDKGAFIAASMTITPKRQRDVSFSDGYLPVQQYIIVNRDNGLIEGAEDLAGKAVHVRRGTSYQERLEELQRQGTDLRIVALPDIPTEELIREVAEGRIEVTIADSNIALRNRRYYPRAIVAGAISEKEYLGWAVHPEAGSLLRRINAFFKKIKANGKFNAIYNRYYEDVESFDYVDLRTFHRRMQTRLPRYREIIQKAASEHGFDWRLIAAQIYQESHYNPAARSHSGAYGLMQLTPSTASSLGVKTILNPRENIEAGVRHLKALYDHFDSAIGDDRLYIALAAYNIGQGHIWDARNLARRKDLDPNRWSALEKTLPLLSYAKYYRYSKYGYCRGIQPVTYVKQILIYYDILKHQSIEIGKDTLFPAKGF
jgi:membrane-bound lytic murein transglycosylase F